MSCDIVYDCLFRSRVQPQTWMDQICDNEDSSAGKKTANIQVSVLFDTL